MASYNERLEKLREMAEDVENGEYGPDSIKVTKPSNVEDYRGHVFEFWVQEEESIVDEPDYKITEKIQDPDYIEKEDWKARPGDVYLDSFRTDIESKEYITPSDRARNLEDMMKDMDPKNIRGELVEDKESGGAEGDPEEYFKNVKVRTDHIENLEKIREYIEEKEGSGLSGRSGVNPRLK